VYVLEDRFCSEAPKVLVNWSGRCEWEMPEERIFKSNALQSFRATVSTKVVDFLPRSMCWWITSGLGEMLHLSTPFIVYQIGQLDQSEDFSMALRSYLRLSKYPIIEMNQYFVLNVKLKNYMYKKVTLAPKIPQNPKWVARTSTNYHS
jgi:hypothetical protein